MDDWDAAYEEGKRVGYNQGYEQGAKDGYEDGFDNGYRIGQQDYEEYDNPDSQACDDTCTACGEESPPETV